MIRRTNSPSVSFLGTDTALKILDKNTYRTYINFYAVSGDCYINIGDNNFDNNAKLLEEGVMWEPRIALTNSVWFKGDGCKLSIITGGEISDTTHFPLTYGGYELTYGTYSIFY